jgi:amino acid transporter
VDAKGSVPLDAGATERSHLDTGAVTAPSDRTDLQENAIGLLTGVIYNMASAAPGQVLAVSLFALVAASAYGGVGAMFLCGLASLCIAIAYQRLNLWKQNAGGAYAWVSRGINPYIGFMIGWAMIAGWFVGALVDVVTMGPATLGLLDIDTSSQWGTTISAVVLGAGVTAVTMLGIKLGARMQLTIALIEYVILLVFSGIAIVYVVIIQHAGTLQPSWDWLDPTGIAGLGTGGGNGSLSAGILVSVFWLAGWECSIYLNEETEQPEKKPGQAAVLGVILLTFFYMLLIFSFQGTVPRGELKGHSENVVSYAATQMTGTAGGRIAAFAILLSVLATTQGFLVGTVRIGYSMARDRVIPSVFGKVSKHQVPSLAALIFGGACVILTVVYVWESSVAGSIDDLIATFAILFAIFYAASALTVVWYYRRRVFSSPKEVLLTGVLPIIGAAVLGWAGVKSIIDLEGGAVTALWIIVGLGVLMMFIAAVVWRSPIFRMKPEVAPALGEEHAAAVTGSRGDV